MRRFTALVMGVSGTGKSTIGAAVASRTGATFLDADDLHPAANLARMRAGLPLTDTDRWPWLAAVRSHTTLSREGGQSIVVACSALKRAYRDYLRASDPYLRLVYLRGDPRLITDRLQRRRDHFFAPRLLVSQLADLEEPDADEHPIIVDIGQSEAAIVAAVVAAITAAVVDGPG